jgi:DNA-binding beta-propeller fold protein YncE
MKLQKAIILLLLLLAAAFLFAQEETKEEGGGNEIDMDRVYAERELEFGVRAFHEGEFNRAIKAFEDALSYSPDFPAAKRWLAEAYYRSGFVPTALDMWSRLAESGKAGASLEAKIRTLEYRRSLEGDLLDEPQYVAFHHIEAEEDGVKVFNRPTSLAAGPEGRFYVVAFGSNELLEFNANGSLRRSLRGGLEGFNHPFDLVLTKEGHLFVTEFSGDRITRMSRDGRGIFRFGGSGTGEGELLGPQFITDDGKGYIYVTDQGNRRVVKFDYEGNYVLSFGRRSRSFGGFHEPTGIFHYRGRLYVADKLRGEMAVFDESGNFIRSYGGDVLRRPEGISLFREGELLVADGDRVYRFVVAQEKFEVIKEVEGLRVEILKAVKDANDNLVTVEFDRNIVQWYADFSQMYSGMHAEIRRILADEFPRVLVEVAVSRREGPPYIGLMQNNFFITEGRYPVDELKLQYAVDEQPLTDISLLVESSELVQAEAEAVGQAAGELSKALGDKGLISVVSAGEVPVLQEEGTSSADVARAAALNGKNFSSKWSFDLGLRLAANRLTGTMGRRALVFLGSGSLPSHAFDEYGLSSLLSYLRNNDITFYYITVNRYDSIDRELQYLCDQTGGKVMYVYRPEGIGEIVEMERGKPTGRYYLTFRSRLEEEFGRSYMPLELQVSVFGRSGRVESGYYTQPEM